MGKSKVEREISEESLYESAGQAYAYTQAYLKLKIDQAKLESVERISNIVSSMLTFFILGSFCLLAFIFGLFSFAYYLGEILDSNVFGFLVVGVGIFFLTIVVFLLRRYLITNPIIEYLIQKIYE